MQYIYSAYVTVISMGIMVREGFYSFRDIFEKQTLLPVLRAIPAWIKPDHLSWSRVPLGLAVVFFLFFIPAPVFAILLYVLAWITDILDGALARYRKQFSLWGCRIDPLADKIMNDSIFIGYVRSENYELSILGAALWVIVIADLATMLLAGIMSYFTDIRMEANILGKWKFGFQCIGCMPLIFNWLNLAAPVLQVAALMGVLSFISYVYYGYVAFQKRRA